MGSRSAGCVNPAEGNWNIRCTYHKLGEKRASGPFTIFGSMYKPDHQLKRRRLRATLLGHTGVARRERRRPAPAPTVPALTEDGQRQAEIEQDLLLARDIQQGLLLE